MMLIVRCFLLALVVLFAACRAFQRSPIYTQTPANNPAYKVEYLFEHEGCKVYRFEDRGNWIYYTNCQGETIMQPDSSAAIRNTTNRKQ